MKLSNFVFAYLSLASVVSCDSAVDFIEDFDDVAMLQTQASLEEKKEAEVIQSEVQQEAALESEVESEATYSFFEEATKGVKSKAVAAEFIAMTLFVTISCGAAMSVAKTEGSAWVLQVSLTFGLCITALAYAIGHYSGGQINCAVTFGFMLLGKTSVAQGFSNIAAQFAGSIFGALILKCIYSEDKDCTGGLATNKVGAGFTQFQALIGEIMGTFLLVFVVFETATDPGTLANRPMACLAIGLSVFLAHSMLIPIDGCSINPTRTFGPALIAKMTYKADVGAFTDMWVFFVGPLIGAGLAAGIYKGMSS